MTENKAKEVVKKLRNKAELFKNSGFAVDGIVKSFEDSANAIETLSEEIQQYRAIGTIEEFKDLKEKNEPKKQGNINDYESHLRLSKAGFLCCSRTNKDIRYPLISLRDLEYCPRCGQALDWE